MTTRIRPLVVSLGLVGALALGASLAQAQWPVAPAATPPAASPSTAPAAPPAPMLGSARTLPSDYRIGAGDVLQINVWKNETLSRIVPVRPDGKISLPLLQDVQAAGLTPLALRDKLATALSEFMPNPEVSVSVSDVRSLHVSVLGQVQRPGVLQIGGATTILEAIAMAGGFRDFASPSKITILRTDDGGKTQKIRFNYNHAVSNSSDAENMVLKPGDVVVVP